MKILFQDDWCVCVHKPAGMTVYEEAPNIPNAKAAIEAQIHAPVWPVHRLDKNTCGVLVFAKSGRAAAEMRTLLASRRVEKTYQALVQGTPPIRGSINLPLTHKGETTSAQTDYKVLKSGAGKGLQVSLLELRPRTGRHHQIRKHLKALGHPILGDETYGGPLSPGISRSMLSAVALTFPHPRTRKPVSLKTHPDADFQKAARKLG